MLHRLLAKHLRVGMVQTTQSAENHSNGASAYRVLGLPINATKADVKDAFYRLAKEVHPDSNRDSKVASGRFVDIKHAYETLCRKLSYYCNEKTMLNPPIRKGEVCSGQQVSVSISLKQASLGMKGYTNVSVISACSKERCRRQKVTDNVKNENCLGQPYLERKRYIYLEIPPGVQHGQTLMVKQPRGDPIQVTVNVMPSQEFNRRGNTVYSSENIPLCKALMGGDVVCRGIDGKKTTVKVEPGQDMINLKGHGLGGKGDHLVQLVVKLSTKPSRIQNSVRKMISGSNNVENELIRCPESSLIPLQTGNIVDVRNDFVKDFATQTNINTSFRQYPSLDEFFNLTNFSKYVK